MELLASFWCLYDGVIDDDTQVCSLPGTQMYSSLAGPSGIGNSGLTRDATCQAAVCMQRAELCSGYMLEELARSPRPKVLDPSVQADQPSPSRLASHWSGFHLI